METNPRSPAASAGLALFVARVLAFVLASASALALVSTPARAEDAAGAKLGPLEDQWQRSDRTERQWVVRGVATAAYAGVIAAAFVERDQNAGRGIATAAGVPLGAVTGITALDIVVALVVDRNSRKGGVYAADHKILAASAFVGGAIAGGVVGGRMAHSLAASPDARAPVTALALAPMYFTALFMTIDWP